MARPARTRLGYVGAVLMAQKKARHGRVRSGQEAYTARLKEPDGVRSDEIVLRRCAAPWSGQASPLASVADRSSARDAPRASRRSKTVRTRGGSLPEGRGSLWGVLLCSRSFLAKQSMLSDGADCLVFVLTMPPL